MFYIVNKQHINLIGQLINFLFLLISVAVGLSLNSPTYFVYTLSILFSIFYSVYIFLSYKYAFIYNFYENNFLLSRQDY